MPAVAERVYKSFAVSRLKASQKDPRIVSGIAATYGKDLVGDVIIRGAFDKTIKERFPKNQIKALWGHYHPIGKLLDIKETEQGLYIKVRFSDTTTGNEILTLINDEAIDQMSIGFDIVKDELDHDTGIRYLKEIRLWEVSFVLFAANPETSVDREGKSLNSVEDIFRILAQPNGPMTLYKMYNTHAGGFQETKAGRVLSAKNRNLVKDTVSAIDEVGEKLIGVSDAFKALLKATEPKSEEEEEDDDEEVDDEKPMPDDEEEEEEEEKGQKPKSSKKPPSDVGDPGFDYQSAADILRASREKLFEQEGEVKDQDAEGYLSVLTAFTSTLS